MVLASEELDTVEYFLKEAQRRLGNLAKSADLLVARSFSLNATQTLTGLLRTLTEVERQVRSLEDTKCIPA